MKVYGQLKIALQSHLKHIYRVLNKIFKIYHSYLAWIFLIGSLWVVFRSSVDCFTVWKVDLSISVFFL